MFVFWVIYILHTQTEASKLMASSSEVKVLGSWQSPFSLRVRIGLNIKSVTYDFQQEDVLLGKSNLLLQSNPVHKKIPVLLHHANPICESLIILHYLDQVWASGPAILPSDPHDRAIARFWASYIDDNLLKHLKENLVAEGEDARNAQEETRKGLVLLEEAFTKCSGGRNFFGGDEVGYLDIALGSFLPWISVIDKLCSITLIDESETPNLFKWANHFCEDAAVKDLLPDADELYDFAKLLISAMKGSAHNVV